MRNNYHHSTTQLHNIYNYSNKNTQDATAANKSADLEKQKNN